MSNEVVLDLNTKMEKTVDVLMREMAGIRTGRATPALVEHVKVDYHGVLTPLNQLSSITVPEASLIVIQPWDKDSLVSIEKAINEAQLGLNPVNDGQVIRIAIPALNEERRTELVKMLGRYAEDAKVVVRQAREEAWDEIQDLVKNGKMGEDDKFRGKDMLQKSVDEYNGKIEEIREKKEKETMEI